MNWNMYISGRRRRECGPALCQCRSLKSLIYNQQPQWWHIWQQGTLTRHGPRSTHPFNPGHCAKNLNVEGGERIARLDIERDVRSKEFSEWFARLVPSIAEMQVDLMLFSIDRAPCLCCTFTGSDWKRLNYRPSSEPRELILVYGYRIILASRARIARTVLSAAHNCFVHWLISPNLKEIQLRDWSGWILNVGQGGYKPQVCSSSRLPRRYGSSLV